MGTNNAYDTSGRYIWEETMRVTQLFFLSVRRVVKRTSEGTRKQLN
jgi:hypothetical protein